MMRFLNKLSFRSKILVGITAVVLVFGLLSAVLVSRIASSALLGEIRKRGLTLGLSLAARTADPLLAQDFLRLKNMVDELKESSDDILYAFIQDNKGHILSHTFKSGFPVDLQEANQVAPGEAYHIQLLDTDEERVYDFAIPVAIGATRLGMVRVGLSRIKAEVAVSRLLLTLFSVSAASALLAVVLGTLLAGTVTRRLELLRKSAEEVVRGNLDLQASPQPVKNCWDLKNCQRQDCPAYGDSRRRCWYLAGTLCPECHPGGYEQKVEACQQCQVYRELGGDEIQSLAEAFDYMALSLNNYIENLKEAERTLTRQQQLLKTMLDVTPDLVSLQDVQLRYQAMNPAFSRLFSLNEQDILGKTDADLFTPDRAKTNQAEDLEILRSGQSLSKEIVIRTGNDKHWFHLVKVPVYDKDQVAGLLLTARDITEIKRFQEKLIQTVKMEELGKLAGGVAHEINTPLGIILGYAQMLLEDLPQDSESHEFLAIIEKQAKICRRIVADLLSFSRVSESRKEDMDLNRSLEEVMDLVRHIFKQDWVTIVADLDPNLPPIPGDKEKLKQVWLNLLNNAFESLGGEGAIWVRSRLCPYGNHVLVSVADLGPGINAEDLKRVFDPFFSTKAPGVGTGLGLSVSYGIVREHQGKILAFSPVPPEYLGQVDGGPKPPGPGALFLVQLPVSREKPMEDDCTELMVPQDAHRAGVVG